MKFVVDALVEVNFAIVPDAEVRSAMFALDIVVVASVEVPVTTNCPVVVELTVVRLVMNAVTMLTRFAKKFVDVALVVEAFVAKKLVVVLFVEFRFAIVPDATVRSVIVAFVIVVVARVVVPITAKRPDVVAFPCPSTTKLRFSVQAFPFQYNVEVVAVPSAIRPWIVSQYVDVPLVARICPGVPVAPLES